MRQSAEGRSLRYTPSRALSFQELKRVNNPAPSFRGELSLSIRQEVQCAAYPKRTQEFSLSRRTGNDLFHSEPDVEECERRAGGPFAGRRAAGARAISRT